MAQFSAYTTTQRVPHSSRAFCAKGGRQADRITGFAFHTALGCPLLARERDPEQGGLFDHGPQHIWQKRFRHSNYDFNAWTERKRIEKLRYMHRNPVKRGWAASPELWSWSSFRAYALGEAGPMKVNEWEVLKMKIRPPTA